MIHRRSAGRAAALAIVAVGSISAATHAPVGGAQPSGPARRIGWRVVEISTGRAVDTEDPELVARAVLPGSLMKLPALVASVESGAITPATHLQCPGSVVVGGRRIGCQHPRRAHRLSAVEAFALSCNVFFARASERLSRDVLNGVLTSFGWPTVPAERTLAMAATGIEGTALSPGALLAGFRQVLLDPPGVSMRSPTRTMVREALAVAAREGTAAAFRARGVQALAKTGTSETMDGRSLGLVLAAWPADRPNRAAIVVVEGGSGPDAATIGAALARGERPVVTPPVRTAPLVLAPPAPSAAPADPPPAALAASGSPPPHPPIEGAGATVTIRVGTPQPRGAYVVRGLPVEDYVTRVLAGEAAARTAPAGLEALAIAARTFAFANRRRHARDGFDLCDSTHCQVLREPYPAARAASAATAGQVLAWQGAPAAVFYTASCGGRTERPSAVWPGAADPPYLPSRRDRGCRGEPRWSAAIAEADVQRALAASGYRGARLRKMRVRDRAASGRVAMLSLDGLSPGTISGQSFRMVIGRALGWQVVKSTAFDLSQRRGVYTFRGHGYGHGVGFCVIGSMRRAADGESRTSLLNAYFPGLQVADYRTLALPGAPVAPPGEPPPALASGEASSVVLETPRPASGTEASAAGEPAGSVVSTSRAGGASLTLQLPAADAKERVSLQALLDGALSGASARTGRAAPAAVSVIVHPSTESFRLATNQPWWADAFEHGNQVDVQPLSVLRQRGVLEQALAHILARTVIAPVVAGRAAWVQDGAAMYAAGLIDPSAVAAARADRRPQRCPSDDELRRPVSAAGARDAHARARDCFARALGAGKRWHEVR